MLSRLFRALHAPVRKERPGAAQNSGCRLRTISAGMMASVSGMRRRSVVPLPGRESSSTLPPMRSTLVRTTSMPTPRPLTLVTAAAVEKPGRKISCSSSRSDCCAARSCGDQAAFDCLGAHPLDGDAGAVVGHFDDDVAAFLQRRAAADVPSGILAGGLAHVAEVRCRDPAHCAPHGSADL